MALLGCMARAVAGPAWSEKDATSFPLSKTLTDPLAVEKKILDPSHNESVTGSPTVKERSNLSASMEYMATSPSNPPIAPYAPSDASVVGWDMGKELEASTAKVVISSGVAQPSGTGRFFLLLDNLMTDVLALCFHSRRGLMFLTLLVSRLPWRLDLLIDPRCRQP